MVLMLFDCFLLQQMRRTGNSEENKRIIMDIDVVLKSHDCQYIVHCLGCFITDADVWICMELMATCFDKLMKRSKQPVPEPILGKVTVAVSMTFCTIPHFCCNIERQRLLFFYFADGESVILFEG